MAAITEYLDTVPARTAAASVDIKGLYAEAAYNMQSYRNETTINQDWYGLLALLQNSSVRRAYIPQEMWDRFSIAANEIFSAIRTKNESLRPARGAQAPYTQLVNQIQNL